ncbi:hypothetical protein Bbelb_249210 [Branchiostoma belcheri]|nr:hypothetical protein Bbelb_249210 [Branchiostoma belcheri]
MAAGRKNLKSAQKVGLCSSKGVCQCCAIIPAVILAAIFGVTRIAALASPDRVQTRDTLLSILTLDLGNLLPDGRELWDSLRQQASAKLQSLSENENVQICVFGYVSAVFLLLTMSLIKKLQVWVTRRKPKRGRPKKNPEVESSDVRSWYRVGAVTLLVLSVCSLVWEWVRMYQIEVAKKAATVHVGFPPECSTDTIGAWTSIKSYLRWHLSWSHDPCEQYHQALLVDPFWEVNPLMALAAAVTRPCVTIVELASAGMGRSLRFLFQEIPAQWQPVVMLLLFLLILYIATIVVPNYCRKAKRMYGPARTHGPGPTYGATSNYKRTHHPRAGHTHVAKSTRVFERTHVQVFERTHVAKRTHAFDRTHVAKRKYPVNSTSIRQYVGKTTE